MKSKNRTIVKPYYVYFKKHECLKCNSDLEVIQKRKIVNSGSKEFKEYSYKYFDSYPIGDIEFSEDVFSCKSCDFKFPVKIYYRLEKMIGEMEKINQDKTKDYRIEYIYENGFEKVFSKKWCCNKCNSQMKLNYEVIPNMDGSAIHFKSFDKKNRVGDTTEFRKLFFSCEKCSRKVYIKDLKKDVNVKVCDINTTLFTLFKIIMIIGIIIVYLLMKN